MFQIICSGRNNIDVQGASVCDRPQLTSTGEEDILDKETKEEIEDANAVTDLKLLHMKSMEDLGVLSKLCITTEKSSKDGIAVKRHLIGDSKSTSTIMTGFPVKTVTELNALENKLQFNANFCADLLNDMNF
ncbi:hypothetical protein ACFFRR_007895, partial [Megaselia abdita]